MLRYITEPYQTRESSRPPLPGLPLTVATLPRLLVRVAGECETHAKKLRRRRENPSSKHPESSKEGRQAYDELYHGSAPGLLPEVPFWVGCQDVRLVRAVWAGHWNAQTGKTGGWRMLVVSLILSERERGFL